MKLEDGFRGVVTCPIWGKINKKVEIVEVRGDQWVGFDEHISSSGMGAKRDDWEFYTGPKKKVLKAQAIIVGPHLYNLLVSAELETQEYFEKNYPNKVVVWPVGIQQEVEE